MKKIKRFISLLLSIVMFFGITSSVDLSAYAEENEDDLFDLILTKENIQYFKDYFLSDLDPTKQAFYIDHLTEMNHENDETHMQIIQDSVNRVQSKWSQILDYMPESITSSQVVSMGNKVFSYLNGTIETFKYIQYIKDEDTRITQKCYHGLHAVNTALSLIGIKLGPIGVALQVLEKFFVFSDLMYVTFMNELVQIQVNNYAQDLYIDYWTGGEFRVPSKDDVSVLNWSDEWVENYYEGAYEQYLLYSLKRMANNSRNITVINPTSDKGYFGGHTYQVFSTIFSSFEEAEAYCESLGGHLAVIESEEEDTAVYNFLVNCGQTCAFLGMYEKKEGVWIDIFGNPLNYFNWAPLEPNNASGKNENLIHYWYSNGQWNDTYFEGPYCSNFICEWDNYIDAYPTMNDEHNYVQTVIAPTCTTDGYTINQCSDCSLFYYSNNVSKLGHNYILSNTVSVSCTVSGYDLYTCSRCNSTEKRNCVDAFGHSYTYTKTVAPTCTAQGYDLYTCSVCNGKEKRNTTSSTGHNYEIRNNTATCTEAGIKTSVCSKCGYTTITDSSALGHSYSKTYTAPTCIESGGYTNTCTRCGEIVYDVYEKNGHDYGECIGEDYVNTIYNTEGKFIESISSSVNYYGKTYYTTSSIGSSIMRKIKVTYPQQIRIDINDKSIIESYNFYVAKNIMFPSNNYLNYIFSYKQDTGRSPDQSAIPYTDKNGNLINMKYVDYKDNGVWNSGEYLVENNNIVDVNGSVVSSSFSDTRTHIVYTKEEALESGIMNNDGTVNVNTLGGNEISFSSGVDGIYTTIFNAYANSYVSALKCDDNVKLNAGAYNIPLCFYSSNSYTTGNLMLKIYDADKIVKKTPATETTDEILTYTCMDCAEQHIETSSLDISNFKIKTVSLSLASSITMNFKVLKTAVADFENPYVQFTRNGNTVTVSEYTEQGDYLVFAYKDIAPQAMNDTVTAVLKATHNTIEYSSSPLEYSVSKYAYTMLDKCSGDQYAKLRTLLVDLLNYGAEAQSYQNYKTDDLVNSKLTDTQKAWASTQKLTLADVTDKNYSSVENALVEWKSASLQLNNSVAVRYKFTAQNVDNLSVKVNCGASQWEYGADSFTDNGDGTYYFLFNDLNADKMSEDIFITVMNGDTAVSNTMRFSVESYSKKVQDLMPNSSLQKLTDAMMRYGKSAANYA